MSLQSKLVNSGTDLVMGEDGLCNGTFEGETMVALHCPGDSADVSAEGDHLTLSTDGMSEFSNSDLSLPEVCISTNSSTFEEDMNYEVQQAYRIFTGFLLDKHKGVTSPFLHPMGHQEAQHGIGGVLGRGQAQLRQSMCLQRMEEKFINKEYETITEFVADFRLMLENCYRYHGVDHWLSKQAQKLEIMLEQKLTLLSRPLREKTTLAVTSKGRFGAEEERGSGGTSTRRRLAPRSLATITVGGHESIMVQTLRLEEQQKAKEEKRQRELEKKEAEEMSAKEVEEWEQTLLSQASPQTVGTLWELPAIGHFLCLAQTALNLPEIVFYELERCLLMPRCSLLLSKIMSSLLSPPQRRATLHRRPALPYRRWESELRQRVMGWYRAVGSSRDQPGRAEQLGLCHQFFSILGEMSPLEDKPFHLLPFYQRVWLLKGLCDHVYETQKDVQDAVLAQPIHECRESILGYDSKENGYIHFPHFCGADLRIYCQSPSTPPAFPFPSIWVKRVEIEPGTEGDESDGMKDERNTSNRVCSMDTVESDALGKEKEEILVVFKMNLAPSAVGLKMEGDSPSEGHHGSSCLECFKRKYSDVQSEDHDCCCSTLGLGTQFSSESTQNSSEERLNDKIWTKKKKRKKKRGSEQLLRLKGEHKQLQHVDRMRLSPAEAAKSAVRTVKRKDKKKKYKSGKLKLSDVVIQLAFAIMSSLVCTSLEELRELISKTEDELDDLESTKKRLGRWYYRREAVKDLHSTLIRLLNELSPWEPKLVKAYQRNRLRLKKEFDDFKKHPEYNNFVREECISSSSSDDDDDDDEEDREMGKEACLLSYHYRRSEEEDLEHIVPRETMVTYVSPNHLKAPLASTEKDVTLKSAQTGSSNVISTSDSGLHSRYELLPSNQPRDSNSSWSARFPAQTSLSPRPTILHPTTGLPKGYTPIPTLLAKSVGNKVTLMKRPADLATTKPSKAQSTLSTGSKSPQDKPNLTLPKSPVQAVYKVPEGLDHPVRKDISPVKISVHPVVDQNVGEKIVQQVVILPPNLLIHKTEEKASSLNQQQSKSIQVPVSKVASPLYMSTNVPGFTIPENRIPVQQVAPLKDAKTVNTTPPSFSLHHQQGAPKTTRYKGAQVCGPQASTPQCVTPNPSPIINPSSAVSTEPIKSTDPKQELKTVCIRDSQSILVTTRGGNTGIVKVQTSSENSGLGSLPTSPVITISPQFKAFLISKTSQPLSPSAPSHTPLCTNPVVTSTSVTQPHKQVPSVIKSLSTVTTPMFSEATGSITVTGPGNQTAVPTVALSPGSSTPACSTPACHGSLTTSSQPRGIPSFTVISQTGSSVTTSTAAPLPAGNMIKKDLGIPVSLPSSTSPAQVTSTMQSCPAQTSTPALVRQSSNIQSGIGGQTPSFLMSSQLAFNKTQTSISPAKNSSIPFISATGTVQQRVVINTSMPLAAGTQILLNNACFVVPPQGLGAGSHVLIFSSPASQQVPTVSATIILGLLNGLLCSCSLTRNLHLGCSSFYPLVRSSYRQLNQTYWKYIL
uniref:KIAA2026 ortholog n=1 Tax=Mastacembelus armatus TaxID=205130 RepID=A0A7N9B002_9TELE